jgi:hypothetical protein
MKYLLLYLLVNLIIYAVVSVAEVLVSARRASEFARWKLKTSTDPQEWNRWKNLYAFLNPSGLLRILRLIAVTPELHYRIHSGEVNWKDELVLNNVNLSDPVEVYKTVCLGKYLLNRETPVEFTGEESYILGKWLNCQLNLKGLLLPYKLPQILAYKRFAMALVSDRELMEKIVSTFEKRIEKQKQKQANRLEP